MSQWNVTLTQSPNVHVTNLKSRIHDPLAMESFVELTRSARPYRVRLQASHQALQGLAHLHSHGIMHRDLKPTNLMIESYDPVHVIVIDYGSATREQTSLDHYSGTIAYIAPEVLELKRNDGVGEPYDCRVDIFGLGLTFYQLFFRAYCEWPKGMNSDIFSEILQNLRSRRGISEVIETMLTWERQHRPFSEDLLSLAIWAECS
jgi:serine/threonine protein kinase